MLILFAMHDAFKPEICDVLSILIFSQLMAEKSDSTDAVLGKPEAKPPQNC
jgi:hypothetical protein